MSDETNKKKKAPTKKKTTAKKKKPSAKKKPVKKKVSKSSAKKAGVVSKKPKAKKVTKKALAEMVAEGVNEFGKLHGDIESKVAKVTELVEKIRKGFEKHGGDMSALEGYTKDINKLQGLQIKLGRYQTQLEDVGATDMQKLSILSSMEGITKLMADWK